jgi:uncharacterized protein DUF1257
MSHFTKVATKISNLTALLQALERMKLGYTHHEQGVAVRGYKGQTINAEVSINMGTYDIGVVKAEDGNYTFVADWWGVETTQGIEEQEFVEQVNQQYAYVTVTEACKEQGYELQEVVDEKTQEIKLVATKWEG